SHLIDVVEDARSKGIRLASIHPMFGPDTELLSGQNLIICQAGSDEAEDRAFQLFSNTAANIFKIPIEQHDQCMTWVLNLPHLLNIIMVEMLRSSSMPYEMLCALGGTTFNKQMEVTAEVMTENPQLYFHIQSINQHNHELFSALSKTLEHISQYATSGEMNAFCDVMTDGLAYLHHPVDPQPATGTNTPTVDE
ncbi:MAG: prephenate dehydrogenase, partial [Gammaproteobacteria bacterium]|nr:prephenate dehydrogenase [Gammaproteobacteria bacterium]